jgi:hypothetical protein
MVILMNMLKLLLGFIAAVCLCACSGSTTKQVKYTPNVVAIPSTEGLNLKLPISSSVSFRGEVCFDDAGQKTGDFLYPAPNVAGFLAAIATHAAVSSSINGSQKNSFQTKADAVLDPYKTVISRFSYQELADSGLKKLGSNNGGLVVSDNGDTEQSWTLESLPVFVLSQDKDTLILQNSIAVYAVGNPSSIIYKNMIQVISSPFDATDFEQHWSTNDGANLKNMSAELFADSIKIALSEIRKDATADENIYKTFHYQEGKNEKLERGQLIISACNRIIIRTLRGWIMSVPAKDDTACHSST